MTKSPPVLPANPKKTRREEEPGTVPSCPDSDDYGPDDDD